MIEVYLFYPVFLAQILILSVVHPNTLARRVFAVMEEHPPETYPGLYPYAPVFCARLLRWYRWLNYAIAAVGLVFLAWFSRYMQKPGWDDGPVETLVSLYFFIQIIPMILGSWVLHSFNRMLRKTVDNPRKTASLERRRLFDFVSPTVVLITALLYAAFLVYLLYLHQRPFPGFAGFAVNLMVITLLYIWTFGLVYFKLFGKKAHPFQSRSEKHFAIEVTIKIAVYSCLASTVFLALNFTLVKLDLQSFEPLAISLFFVVCALLFFQGLNKPPEQLDLEGYRAPQ